MRRPSIATSLVVLISISLAVFTTGCNKTNAPPGQAFDSLIPLEAPGLQYSSPEVSYADARLQAALATLPPTRIRSGRYLRIDVPIENTTDQPIAFDYALSFVDGAGAPLDPEPHWMAALLDAHELVSLVDQTSDHRAQHFRLEIRPSSLLPTGHD